MAPNYQSPTIIVVALLLLAAVTPLAHGQELNAINVHGKICCSPTGNCGGGAPGLPGVKLHLNCSTLLGSIVTLGECITGPTGDFIINATNILGTVGGAVAGNLPCQVIVKLPLDNAVCPALRNITGFLVSVPVLINTIVSAVLGLVGDLTVSLFFCLTISG